jgi:hypothetical protein
MPRFRTALAAADPRPITPEIVRALCAEVTDPANLFVAAPLRVQQEYRPEEDLFWEIFHGRLLDGTQTRQRRQFEIWAVHLDDGAGERSTEPILAIRFDAATGRLYVTRAILCHAHETYDSGGAILTREVQKWQRELVGTVVLDQLADCGALRDELACLLFHAVVGTSRLPLTSIEAPLPGFAFGQLGYWRRPGARDTGPLRTWTDLISLSTQIALAEAERVKLLEFLLRATPRDELAALAGQLPNPLEMPALLRGVFNAVTLSPYTDFAPKALDFVRHLVGHGAIAEIDQVDFICHVIRQLARHLAAYDLITFHHRGANYPDALLLDDLLAELVPLAAAHQELFAGDDFTRRRAIRHGLLLRLEYAGHPVPDAPTSPGENLRVLPDPFRRVPDDQIYSPVTRDRRLFVWELPVSLPLIRACLTDLDLAEELRELGTASFLDRPLGSAKAAGEPDQTLLFSHILFSRSVAEHRLKVLARRAEWFPHPGAMDRWRDRLRTLVVDGLPLVCAGPPPRPGVVSLHDALRVADDWLILRTTRQTLRGFQEQYDTQPLADRLGGGVSTVSDWRLLIPGGTDAAPMLCVYDQQLRLRLRLAADMSRGYASRGGAEFPAAGLRVVAEPEASATIHLSLANRH